MNDEADIAEDPRREIARFEASIEQLADDLERCRKIGVFANLLVAGGGLWLLAGLLGMATSGPATMGSIAAVLGGLVLNGSNRSSTRQTQAALAAAEASRTELIGALSLRTVAEAPETARWLH